jgi:hypothetical protein
VSHLAGTVFGVIARILAGALVGVLTCEPTTAAWTRPNSYSFLT